MRPSQERGALTLSRDIMRSASSILVTGRWRCCWKVAITRSASWKRSSPLSTKTQCSRSPSTLWTRVAATVLSTPPDNAQMT